MESQGIPGRDGEIIVRPGASPLTARVRVLDAGFSRSRVQDMVKVVLRVILGTFFVYGGYLKLQSPLAFSYAIKGFKFELPDNLLVDLSFMIPWAEVLAGLCLICGFFSRGAAFVICVMMAIFIIGIASVIWRGIKTNCGCFGKLDFVCKPPIGTCHIVRNVVLGTLAAYLAKVGAGPYSLDRIRARQHIPGYKVV
jgi:uncharacterized membrane protein YphA (DoxX/SURF4 family)